MESRSDTPAVVPDLTGKIVRSDDYYVVGGGFGDVYKCRCKSDDGVKEVAVKQFRAHSIVDNQGGAGRKAIKMSSRELEIWRRLDHPNIVPFLGIVYGIGRKDSASLVSLWMPNGTLLNYILEHQNQLRVTSRLGLVLDIARGLDYLHSFPIVHGDLTCSNVLVDRNLTARLTDFGYSFLIGADPADAIHQLTAAKPGAVRWAAPELLEEAATITLTSDIYSFGNLALFILSGKQPWLRHSQLTSIAGELARGSKPGSPSSHPMDDQYWKLVEQCWSSVEERPPTKTIVASIEQFLIISLPSDETHFSTTHQSQPVFTLVSRFTKQLGATLVAPDPPGKITQLYNRCYGSGRYGDVYLCEYKSDDDVKEVAVKILRFHCIVENDENGILMMSRRELEIWRGLTHPNIVPFLGVVYGFVSKDSVSLVSSWMPHGTLDDFLLGHENQFTVTFRLGLVLDITSGLDYLHSFPIVHGNLTWNNVLVDDNFKARLTDFGYPSLLRGKPGDYAYFRATVARPGAVRWTAPELLDEAAPVTTESDIYSLGNLALFVLSGKDPWSQYSQDADIMNQLVLGNKPGSPESHPMDDEHWRLVEHCWSSASERPQVEAIARSIHGFMTSSSGSHRHLLDAAEVVPDLTSNVVQSENYCEAGGFGDIYKCQYKSNGALMEVAIKVFRFHCTMDDQDGGGNVTKMSRRELGIWRRLDHPNIVPFLGTVYGFRRKDSVSLVSLWMPNGTLHSYLREHENENKLTLTARLGLVFDVASGLGYLHSFPIVHGDLTCSNVLVDHNLKARLVDFGYSSLIGTDPGAYAYLQATTARPGAVRWAAPELFEEVPITTKTDIYSFGNLALFVLSGKQPWSQFSKDAAIIRQLVDGKKPGGPESHMMDECHWRLVEQCWSSVVERPLAEDIALSVQQSLGVHIPASSQPSAPDTMPCSMPASMGPRIRPMINHPMNSPGPRLIRKFIDLVRQVSGKWVNWDPPIPINVGDYGTLDDNGELVVEGNIYHPDFQKHLDDHNVNLDDHPAEYGEPEQDYILASAGVKRRNLDVNVLAHFSATIKGSWEFQRGKRGALVILHNPRQTFIPKNIQTELLETNVLANKKLVTSAIVCPAYLFYMSDRSGESISVALGTGDGSGNPGLEWRTDNESGLLRMGCENGRFSPLFTLRQPVKRVAWRHFR